jgi:DNA-binding response OmpR family regulator
MSGYGSLAVRSSEDPILVKPFAASELRVRVAAALAA